MILPTTSITSVDDFSPIKIGRTGTPFAPQFWTWSNTAQSYVPRDLSGLSIAMSMRDAEGNVNVCSSTWQIDDAANGKAHRYWELGDVSTPGIWTLIIDLVDSQGRQIGVDERTLVIEDP